MGLGLCGADAESDAHITVITDTELNVYRRQSQAITCGSCFDKTSPREPELLWGLQNVSTLTKHTHNVEKTY